MAAGNRSPGSRSAVPPAIETRNTTARRPGLESFRIAVLGTGNIGRTLGEAIGHD
jgi:hypothetical protein